MSDNSTGLPVKLADAAGTNLGAINSSGALSNNITHYGGTATTLGAKVSASSIPVVIASDQAAISVSLAANQSVNLAQWNGVAPSAASALADAAALPTAPKVGGVAMVYNGTTVDLARDVAATDGNAANAVTGIAAAGTGPGFSRRSNPANLGTANNSASAVDVNGAGTLGIEIGTTTTGTFVIEVTADGTTWIAALAYDVAATAFVSGTSITPTLGKVYVVSVNGMRQARLRTNATLGATVAHTLTLSVGDVVNVSPSGGTAGSVNLTQVGGATITIGQAAMAASLPVVIASNQTNIPTNTVQYGGTNVVTGGVAGSVGVGGLVASGVTSTANPVVGGAVFTTAQPTVTTGQAVVAQATARGGLIVAVGVDGFAVTVSGVATAANQTNVQVVDNSAFTDGTTTVSMAGYIFDEVAGTALTENDAAAARIDAKRAVIGVIEDKTTRGNRATVTAAGGLGSDILSVGGTTVVAAGTGQALPARITDGTAYYTKTGQAAGTAAYAQLSDQTNTASIIAATNALKTDASSIAGAVPSATNALPVRLTDGAAFYSALAGAPTTPKFSAKTSAALGAGASVDLTHYVTSGKTGQLAGLDLTSTVPMRVAVNTELTGAKTVRIVLFTQPYLAMQWRAPFKTFITQASADATSGFSVTIKNMDSAVAADVYSTGYWDEV
jgi:hypothetical protein